MKAIWLGPGPWVKSFFLKESHALCSPSCEHHEQNFDATDYLNFLIQFVYKKQDKFSHEFIFMDKKNVVKNIPLPRLTDLRKVLKVNRNIVYFLLS